MVGFMYGRLCFNVPYSSWDKVGCGMLISVSFRHSNHAELFFFCRNYVLISVTDVDCCEVDKAVRLCDVYYNTTS